MDVTHSKEEKMKAILIAVPSLIFSVAAFAADGDTMAGTYAPQANPDQLAPDVVLTHRGGKKFNYYYWAPGSDEPFPVGGLDGNGNPMIYGFTTGTWENGFTLKVGDPGPFWEFIPRADEPGVYDSTYTSPDGDVLVGVFSLGKVFADLTSGAVVKASATATINN